MHRHKDPPNLSLLAQGRGLLDGGVEIECFGEDRTAYSLSGEPLLRASKSPEGQFSKPYRAYQLALPKTYVTRRGKMVLFTSPEDMIIGQSAALHRREGTSQAAASHLKTVPNLVSSSLAYHPEKSAPSEAGQFTSVYLERLREAAQKAKQAENCQAENLEKGDAGKEGEDEMDAADSGVGPSLRPSSGRLSSLSHFSSTDGTIVNIPDGRFSVAELEEEESEDIAMETREPLDPLQQLVGELSGYMPHDSKPPPKSKAPATTKQSKKKKTLSSDTTISRKDKPKPSREGGRGKSKKKKKKKAHKTETDVPADGGVVLEDGGMGVFQNGQKEEGVAGEGEMEESAADRTKRLRAASAMRRTQIAEERRLEMERKRAEKKALERQRAQEAEERARLEEELRRLQERAQTGSVRAHVDVQSRLQPDEAVAFGDKTWGEGEGEGRGVVMMAEVAEERLSGEKTEQGRKVPAVVHSGVRRREGEGRIGSSFREEMARRKREEEQRRKKRMEAERAEKARLAHEKGARLREKSNYHHHLELGMNRHSQSISRPFTFSYFQYVPPKVNAGKGGGKEKGRVGSRTKRRKQPETGHE